MSASHCTLVSPPQNWAKTVFLMSPRTGNRHFKKRCIQAEPIFTKLGFAMAANNNWALFKSAVDL
jgi:hypothetical protein